MIKVNQKILDIANDIANLENQVDDLYKINLYLLRKYQKDLVKEFDIKRPEEFPKECKALMSIFLDVEVDKEQVFDMYELMAVSNKIREIMKEEMPDPWYCYGFNGKNNLTK